MQSVGVRVRDEAARVHGWSLAELAHEVGVSYETCRRWVQGDIAPNRQRVAKLAKLLNRTPEWVMYGIEKDAVGPDADASIAPRQITEYESLSDLKENDFVLVSSVDVKLSAGRGKEAWHVEDGKPLPFVSTFIRGLGSSPRHLRAVRIDGDSMEPLLFDGDLVLIDTNDARLRDGGVFALRMDGDLKVKRLFQVPGGGMIISSDNKAKYRDLTIEPGRPSDVEILGRVKYRSGTGDF